MTQNFDVFHRNSSKEAHLCCILCITLIRFYSRAKQLQLFDSVSELIAFIDASPELQGVKAEAYESEGLIDEAADLYMSGKEPYTIERELRNGS
jgi:hypothetical protein